MWSNRWLHAFVDRRRRSRRRSSSLPDIAFAFESLCSVWRRSSLEASTKPRRCRAAMRRVTAVSTFCSPNAPPQTAPQSA
jgi:hypothetical protein